MKLSIVVALSFWAALYASSCDNVQSPGESYRQDGPHDQYIVIIDRSASRNEQMLGEAKQFISQVIQNLNFKDRIVLMQMQVSGLSGKTERWQKVMPSPADDSFITAHDKELLSRSRRGADMVLDMFFNPRAGQKILHTDIFTTLHLAGEQARDSSGRRTVLILLSDMLQSDDRFEMEHLRRMPDVSWINREKQAGRLPSLSGSCVLVVGADPTTREGAKVREFWEAYFAAVGGILKPENYRATPPSSEVRICE